MPNIVYSSYFDKLPLIKYDINLSNVNARHETLTNIFFRIRVLQKVLDNIDSYYVVELEEGETPEIIAEKAYNDAGANWMITIANKIIDPQWEWPLGYRDFQNYIIGKYGSVEASQLQIHHYEMVINRVIQPDNITTERRYVVNKEKITDNNLLVPYNYYTPNVTEEEPDGSFLQPGSLATHEYYNVYELEGKTVTETISGDYTDCYTYEDNLNEERRLIKIIKNEYYNQINREFIELTGGFKTPTRRVVI